MHRKQLSAGRHASTNKSAKSRLQTKSISKRQVKTKAQKKKTTQPLSSLHRSFATEQIQVAAEAFPDALTMEQRKIWYNNKMRPIVAQTMQHLAAQFQVISADPVPPQTAIFNALLDHQLLLPIDSPEHPYKLSNNKQELITSMVDTAFVPLGIVPANYRSKYRLGSIPPIEFSIKHKTNTYDLSPLSGLSEAQQSSLNEVTTIADMFAMVLAASGFKDIPENDEEWANTIAPPAGEDHTTDFSHNKITLFHPDSVDEFNANAHKFVRGELAQIQADLQSAQSLDIFDTYAKQYRRKDITQLFLFHYAGGRFPNVEVYKAFLIQQAAQTMLHEQYMWNGFGRDDQNDVKPEVAPNGRPIQIHYHSVAGSMEQFAEQSAAANKLREKQERDVFDNVSRAMPNESYPRLAPEMQKSIPEPPASFLADTPAPKHRLVPFKLNKIGQVPVDGQGDYLNREQFQPLLRTQPMSGLRELFLQHFRHDITTFHNFGSNDLLHKFKTVQMHDDFSPEELDRIRMIVEEMYAQNQLDSAFKEVYTKGKLQKMKREFVEKTDVAGEAELASDAAEYKHVLAEQYPAFAQKSYSILIEECDEHLETSRADLIKKAEFEEKQKQETEGVVV